MPQVIETLVELSWDGFALRVWFVHGAGSESKLRAFLHEQERAGNLRRTTDDLAHLIAGTMPGVNAVQVRVSSSSSAIVIYNDWP